MQSNLPIRELRPSNTIQTLYNDNGEPQVVIST